MSEQESKKKRIDSIDSMRGIAALIVVYTHILPAAPAGGLTSFRLFLELLNDLIFQRGQLGVALFFIISGYVVPYSLAGAREYGISKFIISRIMRLYPAYWISLAAGVWLVVPNAGNNVIFANLTMVQRFMGIEDVLGVYWTLSVELVFYFLIVLGFFAGIIQKPRRLGWLSLGLIATTFVFALARRLFDAPLPAGNLLFLCLMFGGAWLRLGVYKKKDLWWIVAAFLAAILAICWLLYYPDRYGAPWLLQFSRYLYAVGLFFAFLNWRAITVAPLPYLGRISYSIYLFHIPVTAFVVKMLLPAMNISTGDGIVFAVSLLDLLQK